MTKKLTTFVLGILCLHFNVFGQLSINEVMPANGITIADELGEFDDWIEIYNSSDSDIDLAGYFVSDDISDFTLYEIPATDASVTTVPANDYLLLWADKDEEQGAHHLGIKLSAGETLILIQPDGNTIVDSLAIPTTIQEDESYGFEDDSNTNHKIFSQATPLESNANSNDVDIVISHTSKLFTGNLTIDISNDGNNGTLKYTTDGSEPKSSSAIYTNPIVINTNTILKIAYFFNNGDMSNTVTERYVKMTTGMANANSDLPMVVIDTYGQVLDEENKKTVFMSVIEPNNNGRAYGSNEASFTGKAGMKIRGASSASFPKKQWRVELRNEDDSDRKESLLGMPADGDWVLYAPGRYDRALINNALMYEVSNQLGYYAPRTRFVEVYYNDNGGNLSNSDYWGIYILTEKIEVNNDRVDIAKLSPDENTGEDLTGGYLLSLDRDPAFITTYSNNLYSNWNTKPGYRIRTPDVDEISTTQFGYIQDEINKFENALTSSNWLDQNLGYKNLTDITSWVGPHIIRALAKEPDGFFLSHYIIKDKNDMIKGGPIWDFDRALNSPDSRSQNYFGWDTDYLNNPNTGNVHYWEGSYKAGAYLKELTADPCYKTLFYDKWFDWRKNNILNTAKMNTLIDSLAAELAESYNREFNRWSSEGYTPRYGSFQGEINALKTWLKNRSEWIDGELVKSVTYSPKTIHISSGQNITLSNPNNSGTIYFTTDGTDPKQNCSEVSSNAVAYNGGINLSTPGFTYIKSRVKIGNQWGPLTTKGYYINQDYTGLVINEIHYNPNDEIINNETVDGDNFEFIEIKNTSSNNINIAGIKFNLGIEGQILNNTIVEPNGYCIISENAERFEQKYGFAPAGVYSGKLSNGGEEVMLTDPFDNPIDIVEYDDQLPWDTVADNGEYSLALIDAILDNNNGFNWATQNTNVSPNEENTFCFDEDTDGDGVCDDNDQCPNEDDTLIGSNCDDGDACTINDFYSTSCNCAGTFADSDNDGICDTFDFCDGGLNTILTETFNGTLKTFSIVSGAFSNAKPSYENSFFTTKGLMLNVGGVDNLTINNMSIGIEHTFTLAKSSSINIELTYTLNAVEGYEPDEYSQASPSTTGIKTIQITTSELPEGNHTVKFGLFNNKKTYYTEKSSLLISEILITQNCIDCNPNLAGTACDDGNACTTAETYDENCNCVNGQFEDADMDMVCDAEDVCPNGDDLIDVDNDGIPDACDTCNITGNTCNDGDDCTVDDVVDEDCNCTGIFVDSDNDTICDTEDICIGNDLQDTDNDNVPDDCDECPNDSTNTCSLPTYCSANGNNTSYEFIQKISFNTINNNSGNNGGYADFNEQITTVKAGESVSFSLVPGFSSSSYLEAWIIWIDFNQDGDFQDVGESVYNNSSSGILTGIINIPANVSEGPTKMRVAMQWENAASSCGSFTYGEVEDYTVIITGSGLPKLSDQVQNNIDVFPNPTIKEININLNEILDRVGGQTVEVSIFRLSGQLMLHKTVKATDIIQLNVDQLPGSQTYLLQLQTKGDKYYLEKFIKL